MRGLYGHLQIPSKQAFLFMQDFAAGAGPSKLKARTGEPRRETTTVHRNGRTLDVDVYTPEGTPRGGLVLIPGVAPQGKDDPRMVALAGTFARSGLSVVVPDLVTLRQLVVLPEHYRDVVAAFQYLHGREDLCPGGRAGIAGLSFAMGPGLLAALDPTIRDHVRFLFCVGGYHGILATMGFATTGTFRTGSEPWQRLEPDTYARWVLCSCLLDHVPHEPSRRAMRTIVDRRIADGRAVIEDLVAELTDPGAVALYELVTNDDREQVLALYQRLSQPMRDALQAMDLSGRDLSGLKARLILIHGYEDILIPYTESLDLYRRAGGRHRLYLIHGLGHVTLKKPGPLDAWALLSSVTAMLRELER
ncbi:MAG: hypothetical protein JWM80_3654 [Cyanobacteria bacterium RYN_339]|nr:hypothetical protein [Cyanobacteria bacterium RYN_339]